MGGHHHSHGLILARVKFRLQDRDDEIAGRKVVIDQNDFVETRLFDLYLILGLVMMSVIGVTVHRGARRGQCRSCASPEGRVCVSGVGPSGTQHIALVRYRLQTKVPCPLPRILRMITSVAFEPSV